MVGAEGELGDVLDPTVLTDYQDVVFPVPSWRDEMDEEGGKKDHKEDTLQWLN